VLLKNKYMLGDDFSMLDVGHRAAAVAARPLRHRRAEERRAADEYASASSAGRLSSRR